MATGQPNTGDLAQGGVRLLRGGGVDAGAHPAPLGRALQRRRCFLAALRLATLSDQLLNRGHGEPRTRKRTCETAGGDPVGRAQADEKAYGRGRATSTFAALELGASDGNREPSGRAQAVIISDVPIHATSQSGMPSLK